MTHAAFECENLEVTLHGAQGATVILQNIDLRIEQGQFISILGGSGSGKTTLLRSLGGLQATSNGQLTSGGNKVTGPPRGVVTVFQDYANSLLQWRSVRRNVMLGIESRVPKDERDDRVNEALKMVDLTSSAGEYPWRLSGGMQQRVQIARALAMQPSVLLMDEPFGALDAMTKASLQDQIQRVQQLTNTTIVFVTHDIDEAVYMSDRVIVLGGRPANITLDLEIPLPRPRDQITTKESADYLELRHQIYGEFNGARVKHG